MDPSLNGRIGEALREAPNGLTDFELSDKLGYPIKQIQTAVRELHRADFIYDSGERRLGPAGRGTIWYATRDVDFKGPLPNVVRVIERRRRGRSKKDAEFAAALSTKLLECIREVALVKQIFTPDDVRHVFDEVGTFGKLDERATGPAMIKAVKAGYCVKCKSAIISARRSSGWTSVYKSLLLTSTAEDEVDVSWLRLRIETLEAEKRDLESENRGLRARLGREEAREAV